MRCILKTIERSLLPCLGLGMGDRIVRVGNIDTQNAVWDINAENQVLFGDEGTDIKLEVMRERSMGDRVIEERVPLVLKRKTFDLQPALRVQQLKDANGQTVLYIRVTSFSRKSTDQLVSVLEASKSIGVKGLVFDLRNNLGGMFQEALLSSILFLPDATTPLTYTLNGKGEYDVHTVEDYLADSRSVGCLIPDKPIIILVNKGSASSSEVFASALRDNRRAILIGERTFGKSLIQHLFPLPDGGALKVIDNLDLDAEKVAFDTRVDKEMFPMKLSQVV